MWRNRGLSSVAGRPVSRLQRKRIHAQPGGNSILLSPHFLPVSADAIEQAAENSSLWCKQAKSSPDGVEDNRVAEALQQTWTHNRRDFHRARFRRQPRVKL